MDLTHAQLASIMPRATDDAIRQWLGPLSMQMRDHEINTPLRAAMFLATVAEETGELRVHTETSYFRTPNWRIMEVFSGTGLSPYMVETWKAMGQEAFDREFFNWVYDDAHRPPGYRLGNTQPGDGWKYRGRGPMQLTGRGNYARFFQELGMSPDSDPDLLTDPAFGAKSAAHFWKANGCNEIADTGDFEELTRRVNGTTINLALRQTYYDRARRALGVA